MAANGLGCLIMTAVIDQAFRERLVAAPAEVMDDFELTNDEQEALISIRAASFTEFAARLHRWLEQRDLFLLGRRQDDGSSVYQGEGLHQDAGGMDEFSRDTRHHTPGLYGSRPLYGAVFRAMQPRFTHEEEAELALSRSIHGVG